MSREKILFEMEVTGQAKATAAMNTFDRSLNKTNTTANITNKNLTKSASAMTALGSAVRTASPALGQFTSVVGNAGSAVSALTGVVGGVGGLAAGGLVAALGMLAQHFSKARTEAKEFEEMAKKAANTAKEFDGVIRAITGQEMDQAREFILKSRERELDQRVRELQTMVDTGRTLAGPFDEGRELSPQQIHAANDQLRQTSIELDVVRAKLRNMNEGGKGGGKGSSGGGGKPPRVTGAAPRRSAPVDPFDQRFRVDEERALIDSLGVDMTPPDESDPFADVITQREELARANRELVTSLGLDDITTNAQAMADEARIVEDAWTDAMSSVADVGINSFSMMFTEILTGNAEMLPQLMAMLGHQVLNQGIAGLLRAAYEAALGNPRAPAIATAAGAMVAFGGALAGVGAATGGSTASRTMATSTPIMGAGAFAENRQTDQGPTIINIYQDALVPSAEAGRMAVDAIAADKRLRGDVAIKPLQMDRR